MNGSMAMKRGIACHWFRLGTRNHRHRPRSTKSAMASLGNQEFRSLSFKKTSSHSFWTLSFSGAGHLLPYHLGVAKTLLSSSHQSKASEMESSSQINNENNAVLELPIRSVSGSSSGAIAATVMTLLPHRLEEYTDRFLQDRGHAFKNLREMLLEEQTERFETAEELSNDIVLSICTTRCSDGGIELFSFENHFHSSKETQDRLLKAIEASCRIPRSFHPIDMAMKNSSYPDQEGIEIDGKGYVDGGIAAPFPPTPLDGDPGCTARIVVSPIAGEYFYYQTTEAEPLPQLMAIKPAADASWKAPLIGDVTISGRQQDCSVPLVAVRASPSLQNLRNFSTSMGVVPASPKDDSGGSGILKDWYKRGQEDAHEVLNELQ